MVASSTGGSIDTLQPVQRIVRQGTAGFVLDQVAIGIIAQLHRRQR